MTPHEVMERLVGVDLAKGQPLPRELDDRDALTTIYQQVGRNRGRTIWRLTRVAVDADGMTMPHYRWQ